MYVYHIFVEIALLGFMFIDLKWRERRKGKTGGEKRNVASKIQVCEP